MTHETDLELKSFFDAAHSNAPQPSDDLMARILADAALHQPVPTQPMTHTPVRPGLRERVLGVLGGWRAVAGLATATVAGVWIGFAAPGGIDTYTATLVETSGYEVTDLMPSIHSYLLEDGV